MEEFENEIFEKLSIIAGVLVIVGAGAAFGYEEFYDEKNGYQNYVSSADAIESAAASTPTSESQPASPISDVDGKVTEVTAEKITIDIPMQGEKHSRLIKIRKSKTFFNL